MKKIIPILILSLLLSGCQIPSSKTSADESFRDFTYELFCEDVASSTLSLSYTLENPEAYGIDMTNVTFGSFDTDESLARASLENCRYRLEQYPYNALSTENQITYDILSHYVETSLAGMDYILYEEPLTPVTGLHTQLPILLAEYPLTDEKDVQTYLALLETLPAYFDSLISFEECKSNAGLFMSETSAQEVIGECEDFLSMGEDNYLISSFKERLKDIPSLSAKERKSYSSRNKSYLTTFIYPAYESLVAALEDLRQTGVAKDGLCHLPSGTDYYSYLVARDTGSSRSIPELKRLIEAQMSSDLIALQASASASAEAMTPKTPEAMLSTLMEDISHAFPSPADVSCEVKYVPESMQEHLSPAFYLIPALDNYDENVIYINPAHNSGEIDLFTTLAHEGYPGHLYQTTFFSATNPDPIRHLLSFGGYVEGWATYAEMCSYSLLPIEADYAFFLQKNASFILGMYAMADIGIHYQGWDVTDTTSYFSSYGINDEETLEEVHNYIVASPGNYLKYYIGYVEILELKKKAINHYGDDFSQKEFHEDLLTIGPAPFDIIEKYLFD